MLTLRPVAGAVGGGGGAVVAVVAAAAGVVGDGLGEVLLADECCSCAVAAGGSVTVLLYLRMRDITLTL